MLRSILILSILLLTACSAAAPSATPTLDLSEPVIPTSAPGAIEPGIHTGEVLVDDSTVTIYGEFENTGERWLHDILLMVTYYDAAGQVIYEDLVPTEILFAGPGERVPFYIITSKDRMEGDYASFSITASSFENDQPGTLLEVTFSENGVTYGFGEVTGTVRHAGTGVCGYPTVAVAYYDANGKVLAVSSNYLENLAPGQEISFKLLTPMQTADYSQAKVWAACREIDGTPVP